LVSGDVHHLGDPVGHVLDRARVRFAEVRRQTTPGGAAAEPGTGLGQRLDDALVDLWDLRVRDQDWITGDELAPLRSSAQRPPPKDGQGRACSLPEAAKAPTD
jgi:hypothetical protein